MMGVSKEEEEKTYGQADKLVPRILGWERI